MKINKEKELNGNSGAGKHKNWKEKLTRGIQNQIWAGRRKDQLKIRTIEIINSEEQKEKSHVT